MEAIADLIGALFAGIFQIFALGIELAVSLAMLVAEFLFVMVTQGLAAAKQRWSASKSQLDERRTARKAAADGTSAATTVSGRTVLLGLGLAALAITVTGGALWIAQEVRQRRIAETRLQVAALADQTLRELLDAAGEKPVTGRQATRDAWGQPLELFIDEGLLGLLVTVRSAGPDRTPRTIDDIHAFRPHYAGAAQVGQELGRRGVANVQAFSLTGKKH